MRTLFAPLALLPEGWARDVLIEIDGHGNIASVARGALPGRAEHVHGFVIPGMSNLHSHAFQRAMAGLCERRGRDGDDFWSWRMQMYRFLERLTPEDCHAIAAQLYLELLKAGFTTVGEFHYLHRDPSGAPYQDAAEMAVAHIEAARHVGIAITHLQALYMHADFDRAALAPAQRRFASTPEEILQTTEVLRRQFATERDIRIGVAPHSLRAVDAASLYALLEGVDRIDPSAPVHIHIAEQEQEVDECVDALGRRPIEWLLDNCPVGPRWCLVHCTHATEQELEAVARTGAIVGLCPTTEANLGDGLFDLPSYIESGGAWGIGSDSHVSRSPTEELRWIEYGQRLVERRRNVAAHSPGQSVGGLLWLEAMAGGAQALARQAGAIESGKRADLLVLDAEAAAFANCRAEDLLDALVFATSSNPVRHVTVSGRWVIRDGTHRDEAAITRRYREVVRNLRT